MERNYSGPEVIDDKGRTKLKYKIALQGCVEPKLACNRVIAMAMEDDITVDVSEGEDDSVALAFDVPGGIVHPLDHQARHRADAFVASIVNQFGL